MGINRTSTHRDDERKRAGDCLPRRAGGDSCDLRDMCIEGQDRRVMTGMCGSDMGVIVRSIIVIAVVVVCVVVICDVN